MLPSHKFGLPSNGRPSLAHTPDPDPNRRDRIAEWLLYAPLVLTTLFGKLAIPAMASQGLGLGYPLMISCLLIGLLIGRVTIDARRGAYFAVMIGFIGMVHAIREEEFSLFSLLFMTVVSMISVLSVPQRGRTPEDMMRFVANYACLIAICGILQFFGQFVIGKTYAFPIENLVPNQFVIKGFNYLNPLYYGSSVLKTNGIFLLEPSTFSQLMAIGLLMEMMTRARIARLALFTLAIILSYSGTGLIVLAASLPLLLYMEKRLDLLVILIGIVALAAALAVPLRLDVFMSRIQEFGDPRSSGYQRFVGWIYVVHDELGRDGWRALFGFGAGTFKLVVAHAIQSSSEMLHAKILIEYGVVGFVLYVGFLIYCIFTSPMPLALKVAITMQQFMGGAFTEPIAGIALTTVLLIPRGPPVRPHSGLERAPEPPPARIALRWR